MRGYRQCVIGLASAALVLATLAPALATDAATVAAPAFTDIAGSSEATAITALYAGGIINGIGNDQFGPNTPVTRAEMAKIVVNLIGDGSIAAALADETPSYTDGPQIPRWAWGYVNVASDLGILKGFPNGSFLPNGDVTYVQAAAILLRAVGDDHPGVIIGSWPGDYVLAALNLGLTSGVSDFQANAPATRGDIAQMAYNAVSQVPVASVVTSSSPEVWTTAGGVPTGKLGADKIFSGAVTGADATQVTLLVNSQSRTYPLASTYSLQGTTSVEDLVHEGATVIEDSSGNLLFLAPNSQVRANAGTLATIGANGTNALTLVGGRSVQYDSNTEYYVNTPSTGLVSDANSAVAGPTALRTGDSVTYTLQANGDAASVFETNLTILNGVVTAMCLSTCAQNTNGTGTLTVQFAGSAANGSDTVTVQPYTQITLNGQAADLADLAIGDIVNVAIAGGNGQNGTANQGQALASYANAANNAEQGTTQPGLGDGNAVQIAATNESMSGTVTSITTTNGRTSAFTLSSQATPITVDGQWVTPSGFGINAVVTVYLDGAGEARSAEVTSAAALGAVGVVTGSTATATSSGTTYQYVLVTAAGTATINSSTAQAGLNGSDVPVFEGGTVGQPALEPMTAVAGTWTVVANTEAAGAVTLVNGTTQRTITTPDAVFNDSWAYLGYTGLQNGDAVDLYSVTTGGTVYYLIRDTSR